jgi:uncharacterized repeat protein (TIGR03803 family)
VRPANGAEAILYSFQGGTDGIAPDGGLVFLNGALYGTTQTGGASGNGTIFALTP